VLFESCELKGVAKVLYVHAKASFIDGARNHVPRRCGASRSAVAQARSRREQFLGIAIGANVSHGRRRSMKLLQCGLKSLFERGWTEIEG